MTAWGFRGESSLPKFSLDRPITVLVLVLTMVVVGAVATYGIPVELIPKGFTSPFMAVYVPWEDAPPRDVHDKITLPLEEELGTVRGLDKVTSVSVTGMSRCYLRFKQGTDMDIAYREIRDRVERSRRRFPDDVDQVFIRKEDPSGFPAYVLGVAVDVELTDSYDLIQNEIILKLERVDGVASVEAEGLEQKEILIELDREAVAASGLNVYRLAQDLGSDNFAMASGNVRDGSRKLLLRSIARYGSLEELENRPVAPSIRLKDVATITYEEPEKDYRVRAMSKPAYAVVVFKEGEANARDVSRRVEAVLEDFKANPRLDGVDVIALFNQGDFIGESMSTLLESGMIGGVLALMVLFLFLRRLRLTLVITVSIPLSLLVAITVMYFAGETLNIITLLALMVSVGLLVDNAVVVAENIHRLHGEGMPRRDACIKGAGRIALAITMSTLTTIVVFLPVALVEGQAQFFFTRLALPISVALLASLVVALVFVPLAVYLTLSDNGTATVEPRGLRRLYNKITSVLGTVYEKTFQRMGKSYNGVLDFFLRRRLDLVLTLVGVFVVTGAVSSKTIKFVEVQENEKSGFEIDVEMPRNATFEETEAWFLAAEDAIESHAKELGLEGWFHFHRRNFGEIQGWFTNPRSTDLTPREVTERVVELLPEKPGIELFTGIDDQSDDDESESVHRVILNGEDPDLLDQVVTNLEDVLGNVEGVLGVKKSFDRTPNELGLVVDRERAQRYQVDPQVVAGVVGYALRGASLPRYLADGKEVPVRVRFKKEDRESLTELASFYVPTDAGTALPLSAVTNVEMLSTPNAIVRRNKRMSRAITLELEEGKEDETRERLAARTAGIDLPEGIRFGASVRRDGLNEGMANLRFAGGISVVFIYLLMGFLFESFILPLSIILTIPLASVGVIWIHILTGRDIDFLGAVGIVLLIGVVVNNGIVFIDYVNRLRGEGVARLEALRLAAKRRFRPIMMTAITTIGGLLPLALTGRADSGISYTSFALTLIGGMITATLLTLLVVPVFYTFFDDMREAFARALRQILSPRRRAVKADA